MTQTITMLLLAALVCSVASTAQKTTQKGESHCELTQDDYAVCARTRAIAPVHVAFRAYLPRLRPGCMFSQLNCPPRLGDLLGPESCAATCCRFASLKTLLMPTEATTPHVGINVPDSYSRWPLLG